MKTKPLRLVSSGLVGLALLAFTALSVAEQEKSVEPASSLLSVSEAKHGIPAELSYRLRQGFGFPNAYYAVDENLYYSLHWEEFVPHNIVRRAGSVSPLLSMPSDRVGAVEAESSLGEMTLDALLADTRSRIQGFVVVHHGKIVYEQYPGMREDDHHLWFSTAKSVASLLVGLLEADGLLDVSAPIDSYMPELGTTNWKGIPIIDILDMASGLDLHENDDTRFNAAHSVGQFFRAELGAIDSRDAPTSDEILFAVKSKRAAGEVFEYSSLNTKMLGILIERISGQRLADFFSERVWSKIGAEGDAQIGLNPWGGAAIHGMISSRLRDVARYGMLYTPSWETVSSERVVPQALIEAIQQDCRPDIYQRGVEEGSVDPVAEKRCNSRQWDVLYTDGDIYKGGARGQGLYISPARDLVVAWYSTTRESGWVNYARAVAKELVPDSKINKAE